MEVMLIGSYIVSGFMFGLIAGYINEKKGCSYWTGFWCGFFFGILGLVIVGVQKDKNKVNDNNNTLGADEIQKYKKLLEEGSITKEEFENAKQKILSKL